MKTEPNGAAGTWLREQVRTGDALDDSSPRGSFILENGERPVVLLSAGIGVTPVLAMLYSLAAARSTRQVLWLHAARDRAHHPFATEVNRLMHALPRGRSYVCYSKPGAPSKVREDFDSTGHLSRSHFEEARVPQEAEVYLCGPNRFMADMKVELTSFGVAPEWIHLEIFQGSEPMTPGRRPSGANSACAGGRDRHRSAISFARSGIAPHWKASSYQSILELAEACDVPVRWSCRTGVCHSCESGMVSGAVVYEPKPLDKPAEGNILVCCSRPTGDAVIDL